MTYAINGVFSGSMPFIITVLSLHIDYASHVRRHCAVNHEDGANDDRDGTSEGAGATFLPTGAEQQSALRGALRPLPRLTTVYHSVTLLAVALSAVIAQFALAAFPTSTTSSSSYGTPVAQGPGFSSRNSASVSVREAWIISDSTDDIIFVVMLFAPLALGLGLAALLVTAWVRDEFAFVWGYKSNFPFEWRDVRSNAKSMMTEENDEEKTGEEGRF